MTMDSSSSSSYRFATIEGRKRCSLILKSIFHLNQRDQTKPLSVFLVKSGSSGNHLLFRYPFEVPGNTSLTEVKNGTCVRRNNSLKDARNGQQPSRNGQQPSRNGQQPSRNGQQPSKNGQQLQQQMSQSTAGGVKRGVSRSNESPESDDKVVDMISKFYGLNDTITYTRDKLTAVIKSINPIAKNEQEQELFPPIVTAPTIPESVIVDQDRSDDVDDEEGILKVDPLILQVIGLSDSVLTDLFAVKQTLCGQKFEVKINNIRFVGHPISISNAEEVTTLNIVFALKANSSHDIVNCFHEVSHRLSIGLMAEETRTGYLTAETDDMLKLHKFDEHHDMYDEEYDAEVRQINTGQINSGQINSGPINNPPLSPGFVNSGLIPFNCGTISETPDGASVEFARKSFKIECLNNILKSNKLAGTLKQVFDDITITGTTSVLVNDSSLISFCLPQKVHQLLRSTHVHFHSSHSIPTIGPAEITKALQLLRPYHGILLLNDYSKLLETGRVSLTSAVAKAGICDSRVGGVSLTSAIAKAGICDSRVGGVSQLTGKVNQSVGGGGVRGQSVSDTIKIVTSIKPTMTLRELSKETGLSGSKIFKVVSTLVYWGKGFIIYPICLSNVYSIHPLTNTAISAKIINEFGNAFPKKNLSQFLSLFHQGISVKQLQKVTGYNNDLLVNQLIWCLKCRLLLQLHTYVYYLNQPSFDTSSSPSTGSSPTMNKLSQDYFSCDEEDEENYYNNHVLINPKLINNKLINPIKSPSISRMNEDVLKLVLESSDHSKDMDLKEKESILKVAIQSNVSVDTLETFLRLKGHFNGNRHLEDIMFYEGVDRKSINLVIESFDPLLCTSQCEDRAVAQLYPYFDTTD